MSSDQDLQGGLGEGGGGEVQLISRINTYLIPIPFPILPGP